MQVHQNTRIKSRSTAKIVNTCSRFGPIMHSLYSTSLLQPMGVPYSCNVHWQNISVLRPLVIKLAEPLSRPCVRHCSDMSRRPCIYGNYLYDLLKSLVWVMTRWFSAVAPRVSQKAFWETIKKLNVTQQKLLTLIYLPLVDIWPWSGCPRKIICSFCQYVHHSSSDFWIRSLPDISATCQLWYKYILLVSVTKHWSQVTE